MTQPLPPANDGLTDGASPPLNRRLAAPAGGRSWNKPEGLQQLEAPQRRTEIRDTWRRSNAERRQSNTNQTRV